MLDLETIKQRYGKYPKDMTPEELDKYMHDTRSENMLTVKDLIEYLKTQDPNACVVYTENNSNAWCELPKELPNQYIHTIEEDKKSEKEWLEHWFKNTENKDAQINEQMEELYRYSEDKDICLKF